MNPDSKKSAEETVFLADACCLLNGGWKVHLSVRPDSYATKAAKIVRWLTPTYASQPSNVWKHFTVDVKHKKPACPRMNFAAPRS